MKPTPGQTYMSAGGSQVPYEMRSPTLVYDLADRIRSGEYKLPFYADMTNLPEYERRAIFGLMLGNEGKTKVPVLEMLKNAGFDPEKDMLQANVLSPEYMGTDQPWWDVKTPGIGGPNIRDTAFMGGGGLLVDWSMKSSLDGLFAAGNQIAGLSGASSAAATGRFAGRNAARLRTGRPETSNRPKRKLLPKKSAYTPSSSVKKDMAGKRSSWGCAASCRITAAITGAGKSWKWACGGLIQFAKMSWPPPWQPTRMISVRCLTAKID